MKTSLKPIRVLVVEDSPTVRQLLVELLRSDGGFEVIGEVDDGAEAVDAALRLRPDLITMDVNLPNVDGLTATREIMERAPTPIVIVSSVLSPSDVESALTATRSGALMVLPKPVNPSSAEFPRRREEFLSMARAMAGVRVIRRWGGASAPAPSSPSARRRLASTRGREETRSEPVRLLAIGTSTGGPAALVRVLSDLPLDVGVPVVVVQHMARGFMRGLTEWLGHNTPRRVVVASAGELLQPDTVYVAPDDAHLGVSASGRVVLSDAPALNGFRPSVDALFESCARAYGAGVVATILTGMGQDGALGLRTLRELGGYALAQDESSSVVFGMARAAIERGAVDEVLPLDAIGERLGALVRGGAA